MARSPLDFPTDTIPESIESNRSYMGRKKFMKDSERRFEELSDVLGATSMAFRNVGLSLEETSEALDVLSGKE